MQGIGGLFEEGSEHGTERTGEDDARQLEYVRRNASAREELSQLVAEVVAVVLDEVVGADAEAGLGELAQDVLEVRVRELGAAEQQRLVRVAEWRSFLRRSREYKMPARVILFLGFKFKL